MVPPTCAARFECVGGPKPTAAQARAGVARPGLLRPAPSSAFLTGRMASGSPVEPASQPTMTLPSRNSRVGDQRPLANVEPRGPELIACAWPGSSRLLSPRRRPTDPSNAVLHGVTGSAEAVRYYYLFKNSVLAGIRADQLDPPRPRCPGVARPGQGRGASSCRWVHCRAVSTAVLSVMVSLPVLG